MPIATDISVAANGNIRYTGSTANYSVLELHRYLQDYADNQTSSGDDILDITSNTPSDRSTDQIITLINSYNIDDTLASHLYGGSIIQTNGDVIYDGINVIAAAGMYLDIIQNGAIATNFWTTGLNADPTNGLSHRFLLKVRTGAADIDGRRIIGVTRETGFTFSEFKVNGTARGINVMALTYAQDLNNQTIDATVSGWTDITNTPGYQAIDVDNNAANEFYWSKWTKGSRTIPQVYERMKWLTKRGTATTLYGIAGAIFRGVTHEVALTTPRTGTFSATELVSWGAGATAGTGAMLAIDSATAGTKMWLQLLTGVAPSASVTITGTTSSATATNTGTPTERAISQPHCGASTGSNIIGSYGFGVVATDLTSSDKLTALDNVLRSPPNFAQFQVSNLISGDDVLVGPSSGGVLQVNQLAAAAGNSSGNTTLVVSTSIPSDTPAAGTVRVFDGTKYLRLVYTSWTGSTFTLSGTIGATISTSANVFISYIDKVTATTSESFTVVFSSSRTLFIRVRNGGGTPIKTFETTGTLGAGGGSTSVIRQSDL